MILVLLFSFIELAVLAGIGYGLYRLIWPRIELLMIEASLLTHEILATYGM